MSLATICRLVCTKINSVYKFGGCVSRNAVTIADHKINWVRPQRISELKPEQSGDLGLHVDVNPNEIRPCYENSKELADANDLVKRMFTLKFQPERETKYLKREKVMALVKRHSCDRGSTEVRIAAMTSTIHDLQKYMEKHSRNKRAKVLLKETIDKRRRFLRLLRNWDYKRYEWVLENLNLVYKYLPRKAGMVSRKDSLRILTQNYCDKIIQEKLDKVKMQLKEKQKEFYREKAEQLAFILKEEKECGVQPTVTEEEIEEARKKAKELSNS